jgi:GH15 family glucan-1,4-alpha-glucosidase
MARIEDYALIGDCVSAALVSRDGSIDWLCWPRFDSGACFAALLGTSEHGRWRIAPDDPEFESSRAYQGPTMILTTTHRTSAGVAEIIDFLVPGAPEPTLVRIVRGVEGEVAMTSELVIRFDYGLTVPWVARGPHHEHRRWRTRRLRLAMRSLRRRNPEGLRSGGRARADPEILDALGIEMSR